MMVFNFIVQILFSVFCGAQEAVPAQALPIPQSSPQQSPQENMEKKKIFDRSKFSGYILMNNRNTVQIPNFAVTSPQGTLGFSGYGSYEISSGVGIGIEYSERLGDYRPVNFVVGINYELERDLEEIELNAMGSKIKAKGTGKFTALSIYTLLEYDFKNRWKIYGGFNHTKPKFSDPVEAQNTNFGANLGLMYAANDKIDLDLGLRSTGGYIKEKPSTIGLQYEYYMQDIQAKLRLSFD